METDLHQTSDMITDQVLVAIRQITQAIDLHSRYLVKHHGLTGPQLVILKEISKREPVSVSELAKATCLSQSTVTGILIRLEKREWVIRKRCDEDKRRVWIQITRKCMDFLNQAPPPLQDRFLQKFNDLERWEQHMILSSLLRLVSMMNANAFEVPPILATGPIESASLFRESDISELLKNHENEIYPD